MGNNLKLLPILTRTISIEYTIGLHFTEDLELPDGCSSRFLRLPFCTDAVKNSSFHIPGCSSAARIDCLWGYHPSQEQTISMCRPTQRGSQPKHPLPQRQTSPEASYLPSSQQPVSGNITPARNQSPAAFLYRVSISAVSSRIRSLIFRIFAGISSSGMLSCTAVVPASSATS